MGQIYKPSRGPTIKMNKFLDNDWITRICPLAIDSDTTLQGDPNW